MNTTVRMKASDLSKDWHVIDAAGRPLGRVATEAATLLRGKHKPTFEPHLDGGDFVIIVNAGKVRVGGNKSRTMMYYRHSGYPGGLKSRSFEEQVARFPKRSSSRPSSACSPRAPLATESASISRSIAAPTIPTSPRSPAPTAPAPAGTKRPRTASTCPGSSPACGASPCRRRRRRRDRGVIHG